MSLGGRLKSACSAYRDATADLSAVDLERDIVFVGRYTLPISDLLQTHALHLAGHRFQVRYIRGCYSRAMGTDKSAFDPW